MEDEISGIHLEFAVEVHDSDIGTITGIQTACESENTPRVVGHEPDELRKTDAPGEHGIGVGGGKRDLKTGYAHCTFLKTRAFS